METLSEIFKFAGLIAVIILSFKIVKKVTGKNPFHSLGIVSDITREAERGAKNILQKRKVEVERKKRENNKPVEVQMRFGSDKKQESYHRKDKKIINWDMPDVNSFGVDPPRIKDPADRKKRPERDFNRSRGSGIKTFEEFVRPDKLQLDLGNESVMLHDLNTGKFIIDNCEYGAQIENVTGLALVGKSRVDGNPIVRIKCGADTPLLVKVNYDQNRFELVKTLEDHMLPWNGGEKSNAAESFKSGTFRNTINSKYFSK